MESLLYYVCSGSRYMSQNETIRQQIVWSKVVSHTHISDDTAKGIVDLTFLGNFVLALRVPFLRSAPQSSKEKMLVISLLSPGRASKRKEEVGCATTSVFLKIKPTTGSM